jgi:HPt (histidine-containing phosphotransfer) domain-containing protein
MADSSAVAVTLDLDHLHRQTGGDRALEREVLNLFLTQSATDLERIASAGSDRERRQAAHGLVGSARAIGALEVARLAATVERTEDDPAVTLSALRSAVREAEALIRRHLRS